MFPRAGLSALALLLLCSAACQSITLAPGATRPRVEASPTPATFKALDEQTLADQPAETQAQFRAAFGDRAAEEWNAAHDQTILQDMDSKAVLTASPNPVSTRAWAGASTIAFWTGSDAAGQVYVSINYGPEKLFATASRGSEVADWLWRGSTYEFRLYAGTHREHLLRTLTVTRANDVIATLGTGPLLIPVVLLLAAFIAAATGPRRLSLLLNVAFGAVSIALLLVLAVTAQPRAMDQQPFPDSYEYADAARHLSDGDGYVTTVHENAPQPPRYPPAFSIALTPLAAFGGTFPASLLQATPWLGALYLGAAAATAWLLGGPIAAGIAALLIGTSPFVLESSTLLMADALVAALNVILVVLVQRGSLRLARIGALIAGLLGLFRLSALVAAPAFLIAAPAHLRKRLALCVLPGLVVLCVYQWLTFGGPLRTGYDYWLPDLKMFDASYAFQRPMGDAPTMVGDALNGALLGWLCPCPDDGGPMTSMPNVLFYPAVVLGPLWIFAPPFIGLIGLLYAVLHWREPAGRFIICLTLLTYALLCFYVFQAARLAAAPAVLLAVYAAVAAARGFEQLIPRSTSTPVLTASGDKQQ